MQKNLFFIFWNVLSNEILKLQNWKNMFDDKNYIFCRKIFVLKFNFASITSVRSTLLWEKGRIWIRIRETQKQMVPTDPDADPEHWFEISLLSAVLIVFAPTVVGTSFILFFDTVSSFFPCQKVGRCETADAESLWRGPHPWGETSQSRAHRIPGTYECAFCSILTPLKFLKYMLFILNFLSLCWHLKQPWPVF